MALSQPSIVFPVSAFVQGQDNTITFSFGFGSTEIVQSTKVLIYKNPSDTSPVATSVYDGVNNVHIIASSVISTLTAQTPYYVSIITYSGKNATGTASAESVRVLIWKLNPPTLTIDFPVSDTIISVNSVSVQATYNTGVTGSTVSLSNNLTSYKFDLIQNNRIIYTSEEIYGTGTNISNNNYTIQYTFNGVNNGAYILQITCVSSENIVTTARVNISVSTTVLNFKTANVINNKCDGYITVECNLTNISGTTNGSIQNGWLKLDGVSNGYITWDNGFNFPKNAYGFNTYSNWTMQLWGFNFKPASVVDPYKGSFQAGKLSTNTNYIIQLRSNTDTPNLIEGEIDIYIVYDTDTSHVRADMYVYPFANVDSYGISKYIPSNTISIPNPQT